jgi:hypothetical protein
MTAGRLGLLVAEAATRFGAGSEVLYSTARMSAKLRFVYKEQTREVRTFYGLDGYEPGTEPPHSKAGVLFFRKKIADSCILV